MDLGKFQLFGLLASSWLFFWTEGLLLWVGDGTSVRKVKMNSFLSFDGFPRSISARATSALKSEIEVSLQILHNDGDSHNVRGAQMSLDISRRTITRNSV